MLMRVAVYAAVLLLFYGNVRADEFADGRLQNWHQWRGPESTGVAPLGDPPTEWSETKNIKWKVEIPGQGSASPIVWGDRIFLVTAVKTDRTAVASQSSFAQGGNQKLDRPVGGPNPFGIVAPTNVYDFVVLCLDRNTGKTVWRKTAAELVPHEGHHPTASFASASPVTDGKHLWVSFGSRGIFCFDLDGKQIWSKDLGEMQTRLSFGEGSSPALYDDTLILLWDHESDDFIVALDALTGDEKWRQPRDEPSTWSTPLIVEHGGQPQVVTSGSNRVRSYDLQRGELLWECGGLGSNPIATPVEIDGLAIAMSGHHDPAGIAVPLESRGDITGTDNIVWEKKDITSYIASPILYDDLLYFSKGRNAILSVVEAKTGKVLVDQKRLPDQDTLYASPVGAAGRIYFPSREGMTVVIEHGRVFNVLARNQLDETIDASPAIVGKEIFIRGDKHLYCILEE